MIIIGIDPHKASITAAALGPTSEALGHRRLASTAKSAAHLISWAEAWPERLWAVEGAAGLGHGVAQQLVALGEQVVDVPAKLAARARLLGSGSARKTDLTDAVSVASVALHNPKLSAVAVEDHAVVLRLLSDRRDDVVAQRTRMMNRLHVLLRDLELLLHPYLAGLHARLRPPHGGEPVASTGGGVRMKRYPRTGSPDFYAFARDYLPTVQRRSPKTIEAYRIGLECFLDYLRDQQSIERAHVSFDHFDRDHLKGWLAWMIDQRHYAARTVALRLSTVKAFLTYCSAEDITLVTLSQAAKALRPPACARKPIEYLNEQQTRAVLAAFAGRTAKSRRNRTLLILLYDTAARVGEITSLRLQASEMPLR